MSVDPMTYEAQFFGFTPQTCMLRIYIAFQDYLFEVMQAVEQVILKKLDGIPDCDISPVQIRKCTEKFLCFMKGHFDNLFSKMEQLFLQLILRIPSNILLPEDKCKETPYSEEDFQHLQKEIEQLQEKYKTELCTKQALLAELEEQKIVQAKLKQTLTFFDELQNNVGRDHGTSDLGRKLRTLETVVEKESKRLKIILIAQ
uniref:Protein MIS12 homolog n=1 Tax=Rhinopithecus bieti TaxID=61621 RepID=A0A2K6LA27_RHIBE